MFSFLINVVLYIIKQWYFQTGESSGISKLGQLDDDVCVFLVALQVLNEMKACNIKAKEEYLAVNTLASLLYKILGSQRRIQIVTPKKA